PALGPPADGVFVGSTTPTLAATFADPDSHDFGKVVFEVCADSACASSLGSFDSSATNLNVGQTGSGQVPGSFSLHTATKYWWRARDVDSSSAASAFGATRSFTVDTTAPSIQASV